MDAAAAREGLVRRSEPPEGTVLPEFELVHPPPGATPGIPPEEACGVWLELVAAGRTSRAIKSA